MTQKNCCGHSANHSHDEETSGKKFRFDWVLHGSLLIIVLSYTLYFLQLGYEPLNHYIHALNDFFADMWWGIALGIISVGLMNQIPREYFTAIMGRGDKFSDLIKAAIAGVLLDLCNHGILLVTAKLYERGLSSAQVLTFLIASPWNSFSITLILIALVGWQWTAVFIGASLVIAVISGVIFQLLTKKGILPDNPNTVENLKGFNWRADAKARLKAFRPSKAWAKEVAHDSWTDGKMILRWILFGTVIAAAISAFVPETLFAEYFGPTLIGLGLTLLAATIIEICSEGSAPIAAEIMNTAHAPGGAFTFLMAGVATDYTEILIVREFSKSWKLALSIPVITVPQILVIGYILNNF